MVDGETYFSVNGYSQPRHIGFYAEQYLEQEMAYANTATDEIVLKVIVWRCLFLCIGGAKLSPWETAQSTRFTSPDSTSLCPMSPLDANYQVMEVSFGQTLLRHNIKRRSLTVRVTENIYSGKGHHTIIATTQIRQMELFCALLIPRFYISDFETKTEKQVSTQIHCQKSHTDSQVCQGPWRYIRAITSFLVDK